MPRHPMRRSAPGSTAEVVPHVQTSDIEMALNAMMQTGLFMTALQSVTKAEPLLIRPAQSWARAMGRSRPQPLRADQCSLQASAASAPMVGYRPAPAAGRIGNRSSGGASAVSGKPFRPATISATCQRSGAAGDQLRLAASAWAMQATVSACRKTRPGTHGHPCSHSAPPVLPGTSRFVSVNTAVSGSAPQPRRYRRQWPASPFRHRGGASPRWHRDGGPAARSAADRNPGT